MSWAGLRALVTDAGKKATEQRDAPPGLRSREHVIVTGPRGMLTIAGGKLTTFRHMGAQLIDRALELLAAGGHPLPGRPPPRDLSTTEPLPGGAPINQTALLTAGLRHGLAQPTIAHLAGQYGSEAPGLLALIEKQPDLKAPVHPNHGAISAQVVFAVRTEYARRLDDVLFRRLSLAFETPDAGLAALPAVARLMARELGWDDDRRQLEIERYHEMVAGIPRGRSLSSD
jgi:glycerol-3-phosphate dehydrogenase